MRGWLRQPSFVFGQLQVESRKAFSQLLLEILRIYQKLEASHEIICETHQVRLALALRLNFFSNHRSSVKCRYTLLSTGDIGPP